MNKSILFTEDAHATAAPPAHTDAPPPAAQLVTTATGIPQFSFQTTSGSPTPAGSTPITFFSAAPAIDPHFVDKKLANAPPESVETGLDDKIEFETAEDKEG